MTFLTICLKIKNLLELKNMKTFSLEMELRKLGLKEKEVKVYLAGLKLGPSSVQKIAEAAGGMTRPTTYEIIRRLAEKRLFSTIKENKKQSFIAQSPEGILGILRTEKKEIEEKEREFIRIIASLEAKYPKEWIKIFKGKEGLNSLVEIISFSSTFEIFIFNSKNCPIGIAEREKIFREIKKRLGKIKITEIVSSLEGCLIVADKVVFFPRGKKEGLLLS